MDGCLLSTIISTRVDGHLFIQTCLRPLNGFHAWLLSSESDSDQPMILIGKRLNASFPMLAGTPRNVAAGNARRAGI